MNSVTRESLGGECICESDEVLTTTHSTTHRVRVARLHRDKSRHLNGGLGANTVSHVKKDSPGIALLTTQRRTLIARTTHPCA
jgi:hypothetical protein